MIGTFGLTCLMSRDSVTIPWRKHHIQHTDVGLVVRKHSAPAGRQKPSLLQSRGSPGFPSQSAPGKAHLQHTGFLFCFMNDASGQRIIKVLGFSGLAFNFNRSLVRFHNSWNVAESQSITFNIMYVTRWYAGRIFFENFFSTGIPNPHPARTESHHLKLFQADRNHRHFRTVF